VVVANAQTGSIASSEVAQVESALAETAAPAQPASAPRDPNCLRLGITAPDRDCSALARAQDELEHADLAFNDPETMMLHEPELLVLALEPRPGEDVATALDGTAGVPVVVRDRRITYRMRAELTSPDHFKIEPKGPRERAITLFARTTWEWTVTPIVEGKDRRLRLKVWGMLQGSDGNPTDEFEIETLNAQIDVDVTLGQRISLLVGSVPNTSLRTAGLWLAGLLGLLLLAPRVTRGFNSRASRSAASAEAKELFVSYSRKDKKRVRRIVKLLEAGGMSVAWDNHFLPGTSWRKAIEQALEASSCVVVLWSQNSVKSHWVVEEATYALDHNKIVPARLDDVRLPIGFREVQTFNLAEAGPAGEPDTLEEFVSAVRAVLASMAQLDAIANQAADRSDETRDAEDGHRFEAR